MHFLKLVFKNIFRHKLRSLLTLVGLVVAILAFGLLQTVVNAWYAGSDMASAQRLITRNATSLVFPLPIYYRDRIKAVDGVTAVSVSNWFGGIYKDMTPANFFAQFGVDQDNFFDLYPEFRTNPEELLAFKKDRRGAMVGRLLADQHGFKVGDVIALKGTIYPGTWEFVVRGIYEPKDETTITRQFYFHWDYLNEQIKKLYPAPRRAGGRLRDPDRRRLARGGDQPGDRQGVPQLARRDAHRDGEGLPALLHRPDRDDRHGGTRRLLRGDRDHLRGGRQHHGDDRARAAGGVRDAQGAGLRPRASSAALIVGESRHDHRAGRGARDPGHLPGGRGIQGGAWARSSPCSTWRRRRSRCRPASALAVGAAGGRAALDPGRAGEDRGGAALHRMKIPLSYILRNLWTRKLTTLLTAGGMALVVFVFAAVLMLDAGLRKTLVSTGSYENAVLLRPASQTEIQSAVYRDQASLVETLPEVARGEDGTPLVSKETIVLIAIPKRGSDKPANLVVRGLPAMGLRLRPQVKIVDGRMFRPGTSEVVVGRAIADGFDGTGIGEKLRFAGREWTVVGTFDGGRSGFDSEIWGDVDQMMQAFRRTAYSSVLARLRERGRLRGLQGAHRGRPAPHPRGEAGAALLPGPVEDRSRTFISYLGVALSAIFSIGAMIGAMITMYAAVANRTREIGTLRALGFRRASILAAFLAESLLLALAGGVAGLVLASFLQAFTITTMNWQSFSQLAFGFYLTPGIVAHDARVRPLHGPGGRVPAQRARGAAGDRRFAEGRMSGRILATYRVAASGAGIEARARALAAEQSVEMPVDAIRDPARGVARRRVRAEGSRRAERGDAPRGDRLARTRAARARRSPSGDRAGGEDGSLRRRRWVSPRRRRATKPRSSRTCSSATARCSRRSQLRRRRLSRRDTRRPSPARASASRASANGWAPRPAPSPARR